MALASNSMMIGKLSLVIVTFLYVVMTGRVAAAAVACNQVTSNLTPCVSYVLDGGAPPSGCCAGVKNLNQLAKTTSDRREVCQCLKAIIKSFPYTAQNVANAAALPAKCRVNLPYKIDPMVNCSNIP